MAAAPVNCHLRANLPLKNTKKSTQIPSGTMWASTRYCVTPGTHQFYSPYKTLHNHRSLASGVEKEYGLAQTRPNPAKNKVSLGRNSLQLFAFSGSNPLSINRALGNEAKEFKQCTHACSGNNSASVKASVIQSEHRDTVNFDEAELTNSVLKGWTPPRYVWRSLAAWVIAGQVISRILRGRIHARNCLQQLELVGPGSIGVCMLTAAFVGRVGSAFAAELGTMQVSEQTDTLRVLGTDPVDYLVIPRVFACCVALPSIDPDLLHYGYGSQCSNS
ncbi:hypothetical protein KI387_017273 [Taxus chinensis]|uniref:Uncharacterized protein n=1 Tax=Taxus chinensis TaxID=29808 RepID=A0AA38GIW3_TAXCH|nr:hypothetical protein KI387_017273 [Taxus chinensis]